MQDQRGHNDVNKCEGESDGSTQEIREERKTVFADKEDSDSDEPPSDFDA